MKLFLYRAARRLKKAEYWLTAQLALGALAILRMLPPERATNFAERTARRFGPWFGRHRVAMDNLRHAFPDRSEEELEAIASDMWGNMARLAAEYIFLDSIFDFDPQAETTGRVEVDGIEIFERVRAETDRPHIFFTAHLGYFELLPITAATFDLDVVSLFRPPNNPYIADYILSTRQSTMGDLLASEAGAALQLARVLGNDGNIGALVDQKFSRGVKTRFFGRDCLTNPLVAKLARRFDCDVYPTRCVRLPGERYRLEVFDRIELPRDARGTLDIPATMQSITSIVEDWVREYPGQWMWFHKRWKMD